MLLSKKFHQKILMAIVGSLVISNHLLACTTFVINDSTNLVYGRNFDFDIGHGFISINKRGLTKQSVVRPPYEPAKWTSKYGSITFNHVGIDAPMEGMNEKGLVIAQMGLFETKYPAINGENALNGLEWIQYQLDNSKTLDEVIENSKKVNIDPIQVVPMHYLICDSLGNIGVIEFINGKMVVIKGKDISIPVCSNMPYQQSLSSTKIYDKFGGSKKIPKKWDNIPDIIAIANSMIMDYKSTDNPIDYSFKILNAVGSDTRTQWSIVFDIKNKKINFKTLNNKSIRTIDVDNYSFMCDNEIKIMDIQKSNDEILLPKNFSLLTYDFYFSYKAELLEIYKANIKGFPDYTEEHIKSEVEYAFNRKCNSN